MIKAIHVARITDNFLSWIEAMNMNTATHVIQPTRGYNSLKCLLTQPYIAQNKLASSER